MLSLLGRFGPFAPLIVFVGAAAESAAFIGLLVPGELLVILGGALAGTGAVPLWLTLAAGVSGAVVGDAIGYWLGYRYGPQIMARPRFARFAPRLDGAAAYLERHGWWALVVARFPAMLRAVVPFAAGMTHMRYSRFALGNVMGGVVWGCAVTGMGYAAGSHWEAVESFLRRGGVLLAVVVALVAVLVLAARWVALHPYRVRAALRRLVALPVVGRALRLAVTAWGRPRPFVRVLPHLTVLAALVAFSWAAAVVDWWFVETRLIRLLAGIRTREMAAFGSELAALAGRSPLPAVVAGAGVVALALRRPRPGLLVTSAFLLQWVAVSVLHAVADRSLGPIPVDLVADSSFPARLAADWSSLLVALAWPWGSGWVRGVSRVTVGLVPALVLPTILVLSGVAYPVDALAGVTIGIASVLAAGIALDDRLRRSLALDHRSVPEPPPPLPTGASAPAERVP